MNKKYIIFPIIMIILSILTIIFPYEYSYHFRNSSIDILQIMDITGYTKLFCFLFLFVNTSILLICFYQGIKGLKKGYNYIFNKIFAITFIVFAIVNLFAFIIIRNKEENISIKEFSTLNILDENYVYELQTGKKTKKKNSKTDLEIIQDKMNNDPYFFRKLQINNEIEIIPSKFQRYVYLLIYWNYYNENRYSYPNYNHPSASESYYAIYSVSIILNLICSGFYIKNLSVENNNKKSTYM